MLILGPSYTLGNSQGELPKTWNNTKTVLYKANNASYQKTYNIETEYVCSKIAQLLGIYAVNYSLVKKQYVLNKHTHNDYLCACNNFIKKEYKFITAFDLCLQGLNYKQIFLETDLKAVCQMLIFDFLIVNTDRHLRNYGLLQSIETGKLTLAPIFDNDKALYSELSDESNYLSAVDIYAISKVRLHSGLLFTDMQFALKSLHSKGVQDINTVANLDKLQESLSSIFTDKIISERFSPLRQEKLIHLLLENIQRVREEWSKCL